jgi:uncharacterized protein YndB with AHSA1/START domain
VIYRALLDPSMVSKWRVPSGMTSIVHEFDAREGGSFRISLTYVADNELGTRMSLDKLAALVESR